MGEVWGVNSEQSGADSSSTSKPKKNKKQNVKDMNIGLYYILKDARKQLAFRGEMSNESLIKVLVLTCKIQQAGGKVIPVNQEMMKTLPQIQPTFYQDGICSP
ncbi:hypothetical protein CDAR_226651 [Caerostris darwini]|uniref:Uncharacterized protein n=1 Tax=Caerostris darwini TaxID=1538125 RepID=A0AAV4TU80_9ARAC|nr:hypothetical protein CDAR_226651 [Caerostris darwini]